MKGTTVSNRHQSASASKLSPSARCARRITALASTILMALAAGVCLAAPAEAATSSRLLSVTPVKQEQSYWCWAASVKMVVRYDTNLIVTQCDVVKAGLASTACANSAATLAQVTRALDG